MRPSQLSLGTVLALLLVLLAVAAATPVLGHEKRPNVLFIAVDDLNDWTGAMGGHPQARTPNIDRLAARGIAFTRAYCAAPACNPSRAALLSGRPPSSTGVYRNDQPWRAAMPDAVTLPRYFRDRGYDVRGGGKIFHGGFEDPESWSAYEKPGPSPLPAGKAPLNGIAGAAHFDWGPLEAPASQMSDWALATWGADYLRAVQSKPFFLAVGFVKPHLPWYVPREYFERFPVDGIKLPMVTEGDLQDVPAPGRRFAHSGRDHARVLETHNWQRAVQGYLASISFVDDCIGRLLDGLSSGPHAGNTLVVLWGDHGWHLGQKEHWRKFALWEEATRTTLVVAGPGVARGRCERTVSLMDLYPTLTEWCGLTGRPNVQGRSLIPLLKDPVAPWNHPVLTTHERGNHAVRSERWRYIRYADGSEELYDHDADPYEWKNLASEAQWDAMKAELRARLPKVDAPDAARGKARDD